MLRKRLRQIEAPTHNTAWRKLVMSTSRKVRQRAPTRASPVDGSHLSEAVGTVPRRESAKLAPKNKAVKPNRFTLIKRQTEQQSSSAVSLNAITEAVASGRRPNEAVAGR